MGIISSKADCSQKQKQTNEARAEEAFRDGEPKRKEKMERERKKILWAKRERDSS